MIRRCVALLLGNWKPKQYRVAVDADEHYWVEARSGNVLGGLFGWTAVKACGAGYYGKLDAKREVATFRKREKLVRQHGGHRRWPIWEWGPNEEAATDD